MKRENLTKMSARGPARPGARRLSALAGFRVARRDGLWYNAGMARRPETIRLARLALVLLPLAAWGLRVEVPPMAPEHADTEATTNVAFGAARVGAREVELRFVSGGSPSNCVQAAFGFDADGDGVLSFEETDAAYGLRNGRVFAEDVKSGVRTEEDGGASGVLEVRMRLSRDSRPELFAATNGNGAAALAGLSASAPDWLWRPEWNLMRVTRRGPGVPAERFACGIGHGGIYLIVK